MAQRMIRLLRRLQGLSRVPGLAAARPPAARPQALGFGLPEPVGGRRLATIVGVFGPLLLQLPDPLFAGLEAHGQLLNLTFQRMDARVHLQQNAHDGFLARAIDGVRLLPRHHAHSSRRKSVTSG